MKLFSTKKKSDEKKDEKDVALTDSALEMSTNTLDTKKNGIEEEKSGPTMASAKKSRFGWMGRKEKTKSEPVKKASDLSELEPINETKDQQNMLQENPLSPSIEQEREESKKQETLEKEPTSQQASDIGSIEMTRKLIKYLSGSKEKTINPSINFEKNRVLYPLMKEIGESEYNVDFLEKLASKSTGILERGIFERLSVCPEHPEYLSTSVRLYCPECFSIDIEKLHLIEHKVCGYIAEMKEFGVTSATALRKCQHCKREIRNPQKEIRMPGRWYKCDACNKKFDNAKIKLHCREFNHDFDVGEAQPVAIPYYKIRSEAVENVEALTLLPPIKKKLTSLGLTVKEFSAITGKSGIAHQTSIYAYNDENKTIAVIIKSSKNVIEDAEVNSILVNLLDISATLAIIIGIPSVSETAKTMVESHGIAIVSGKDHNQIVAAVEDVLANKFPMKENSANKI